MTRTRTKLETARAKKASEIMKKKLVRKEGKKLFAKRMQIYSRHQSKLEAEDISGPRAVVTVSGKLRIRTMVKMMKTMLPAARTTKVSRKISHMSN